MVETRLILLMFLAHLLGDFVFQGDTIIQMRFPKRLNQIIKSRAEYTYEESKKKEKGIEKTQPLKLKKILRYTLLGNLLHAFIHGIVLCSVLVLSNAVGGILGQHKFFNDIPINFDAKLILGVIGSMTLIHFCIDQLKVIAGFKYPILSKTLWLFIGDQVAHFISIFWVLSVYSGSIAPYLQGVASLITAPIDFVKSERLIFIAISFIFMTSFGGILIEQIIGHLDYRQEISYIRKADELGEIGIHNDFVEVNKHTKEIRHGGYIIGILERILILCSLLMNHTQLIGYILTAKSIARLTKLKEDKFAEYFLIGNSLSFMIAIAGGSLIKFLLNG